MRKLSPQLNRFAILPGVALWVGAAACQTSAPPPDASGAPDEAWAALPPDDGSAESGDAERAMNLVAQAVGARQQGRYDEAVVLLEQALAADPRSGLAHLEYALTAMDAGHTDKNPRLHLEHAIALLPENPRARYSLAVYQHAHGDEDGAITGYRATLRLLPEHAEANLRLGQLLVARGDDDAAVAVLNAASQHDQTAIPALIALAETYERKGALPEAESALQALVARMPASVPFHARLLAFYERTQQPKKVAKEKKRLDKLAPKKDRKLRKLRSRRKRNKR